MPPGITGSLAALYWDERGRTLYVRRCGEAPFALDFSESAAAIVEQNLWGLVKTVGTWPGVTRRVCRVWSPEAGADGE